MPLTLSYQNLWFSVWVSVASHHYDDFTKEAYQALESGFKTPIEGAKTDLSYSQTISISVP